MSERRTPIAPDLQVNRYSQAVPRPRKVCNLCEPLASNDQWKLISRDRPTSDMADRCRLLVHHQLDPHRRRASKSDTSVRIECPLPPQDDRIGQPHAEMVES